MLVTTDNDLATGSTNDWVVEHQKMLKTAYHHTKDQLKMSAECKNRQLVPNITEILAPGTLDLRKNNPFGRNKIQDVWDHAIHEIVRCLDDKGRVYTIQPRNGAGAEKNINRTEFKVLPSTARVYTPDSPSELHRLPQEEENDLDMSEDERGSMIMVDVQPLNSENPQVTPHDGIHEDPPATISPEPQLNCLADPLHDEPSMSLSFFVYFFCPIVVGLLTDTNLSFLLNYLACRTLSIKSLFFLV